MHNFTFMNFNVYNLLFYYVIYSFLGWCAEVGYAYKNQRKFVNRGFLHGPLCPIYGACILSIVVLLSNFDSNIFVLILIAALFTSFIEYFTGFLLEKMFKTKYWDYTEDPFNLHGRICLHFSLMWGAVSVVIARIIHPIIASIVNMIPEKTEPVLFYFTLFLLLYDFYSTLKSLVNFNKIADFIQIDAGGFVQRHSSIIENYDINERIQDIKNKFNSTKKR